MLLLVKWADNDGIIMLMVVCTSVVKVVEFKACEILSLDQRYKLCLVKKDTKFNQVFCLIKSPEIIFIFYQNFTWLYGARNHQRILKKYPFLKYDHWFPYKVSKFTLVRNMIDLSLKYWFIEAKVVFWICSGPKKYPKYI